MGLNNTPTQQRITEKHFSGMELYLVSHEKAENNNCLLTLSVFPSLYGWQNQRKI